MAAECNVIGRIWPEYASRIASACAKHDANYHAATVRAENGEPRGSRFPADLQWFKDSWTAAPALVDRARTAACYAALVVGSWWLWYDLDKSL